jgi:hypothetical protein
MVMSVTTGSGLPEATLFIAGPGLNPEAVTRAIGKCPYKVSHGSRPRWFWTSAREVRSGDADDHPRAVLDLVKAFARQRQAFPNVELRSSLFLPGKAPRPRYSKSLIRDLLRFGPMTLNLSSEEEPVVLPQRPATIGKAVAGCAQTIQGA